MQPPTPTAIATPLNKNEVGQYLEGLEKEKRLPNAKRCHIWEDQPFDGYEGIGENVFGKRGRHDAPTISFAAGKNGDRYQRFQFEGGKSVLSQEAGLHLVHAQDLVRLRVGGVGIFGALSEGLLRQVGVRLVGRHHGHHLRRLGRLLCAHERCQGIRGGLLRRVRPRPPRRRPRHHLRRHRVGQGLRLPRRLRPRRPHRRPHTRQPGQHPCKRKGHAGQPPAHHCRSTWNLIHVTQFHHMLEGSMSVLQSRTATTRSVHRQQLLRRARRSQRLADDMVGSTEPSLLLQRLRDPLHQSLSVPPPAFAQPLHTSVRSSAFWPLSARKLATKAIAREYASCGTHAAPAFALVSTRAITPWVSPQRPRIGSHP